MDLAQYAAKTGTTPAAFRRKLAEHGETVSHQSVMFWFKGERMPSTKRMSAIEAATNGKVTRHELRPDVYGPAPKKRKA